MRLKLRKFTQISNALMSSLQRHRLLMPFIFFFSFMLVAGAHTIGYAQCFTFKRRLFNFKGSGKPDPSLDASTLGSLQSMCPNIDSSNTKLAPLDSASTYRFDNMYYTNLVNNTGLLESDQALMSNPETAAIVISYSTSRYLFWNDFARSMAKLGNLGVLTGQKGQIRKTCGSVNNL